MLERGNGETKIETWSKGCCAWRNIVDFNSGIERLIWAFRYNLLLRSYIKTSWTEFRAWLRFLVPSSRRHRDDIKTATVQLRILLCQDIENGEVFCRLSLTPILALPHETLAIGLWGDWHEYFTELTVDFPCQFEMAFCFCISPKKLPLPHFIFEMLQTPPPSLIFPFQVQRPIGSNRLQYAISLARCVLN